MENRLILIGAGGFGREVLSWAYQANNNDLFPKVGFYIDDNSAVRLNSSYNCSCLGSISDYVVHPGDRFLMGIASPSVKEKIHDKFFDHLDKFVTLVHPSAVVARTATIGRGVVLCPFSLISADVCIGDFVTVNAMSSIGHDSVVGRFSTLSGHVDITGQVNVGNNVFFGTGAKVVPRIKIGSNSKIGAGCTVMRSVKEGATYITQPAKNLFG